MKNGGGVLQEGVGDSKVVAAEEAAPAEVHVTLQR